jgi:CRISPR-associated protein Csx14
MGGQAQVVTFALDALLAQDEAVREVVVLHLSPEDPRVQRALAQLGNEFANDYYAHADRPCRLRFFPIRRGEEKLDDIRNEAGADAAWSAIHDLVATLKGQKRHLHLCIAGGRRILALVAMSAAMLHFGHHDRLWHMYTPRDFLERAQDGAILHAQPEDGVRLIQVPLAPWGTYFPALRALTQATPAQVIAAQTRWLDQTERARCRAVVARLTPRQLDVLRAFAASQSPQEVAEALCISLKTVDTHKTAILGECRNAWNLPGNG